MRIAIQGTNGSYSEQAASLMLGNKIRILEYTDFLSVFESVLKGESDLAVVPVWNKVLGEIESVTRLLRDSSLTVLKETQLPIKHALIGIKETKLEKIKTVISQNEALLQCRKFLDENQLLIQKAVDTAASVKRVIELNDPELAAIGSYRAATIYGGKVLRENISDDPENSTLFYLIGAKRIC